MHLRLTSLMVLAVVLLSIVQSRQMSCTDLLSMSQMKDCAEQPIEQVILDCDSHYMQVKLKAENDYRTIARSENVAAREKLIRQLCAAGINVEIKEFDHSSFYFNIAASLLGHDVKVVEDLLGQR